MQIVSTKIATNPEDLLIIIPKIINKEVNVEAGREYVISQTDKNERGTNKAPRHVHASNIKWTEF